MAGIPGINKLNHPTICDQRYNNTLVIVLLATARDDPREFDRHP